MQRQFCRSLGIQFDSERAERSLEKEIMCGDIKIKNVTLKSADKSAHLPTPVGVTGDDDLPVFVSKLLDQYEEEGLLSWHGKTIPEEEIWVKIGGDHGGGSFKLMLQVANVHEPNSKSNTVLLMIADWRDSQYNLKRLLMPYKQQVTNLQKSHWKGKQIRVFLFGDYDFLVKIYGLSGPQSTHPCLWCTASKQQTQKSPTEQPQLQQGTIKSIKRDRRRFRRHGNNIKNAKAFNNVIHQPLSDVPLSQVAPPYLHILLGVGKKHHDLLEKDCHTLDKNIAASMAESLHETLETKTCFGKYVNKLKEINTRLKHHERELETVGTELAFYDLYSHQGEGDSGSVAHNKQLREQAEEDYSNLLEHLEKDEEILTTEQLPFRFGPVTASLDTTPKENKIAVQAYHGRSFLGNHCHKYLQPSVIDNICQSVVRIADETSNSREIKAEALGIGKKFHQLNTLYSSVHKRISHKRPVTDADIREADKSIVSYMNYFRKYFPDTRIIPKQHILEHHCIDFMKTWHFGLALHGEQGGEETHALINELKVRVRGVNNEENKIRVLMKDHFTAVSPVLRSVLPSTSKKRKIEKT